MNRPIYANVVATLALLVAGSGGAYAATQLPKDSVRTKQVKDHSLTARDFRAGELAAGLAGTPGTSGPKGVPRQGAPGGTGRHGGLKCRCLTVCRFKSGGA